MKKILFLVFVIFLIVFGPSILDRFTKSPSVMGNPTVLEVRLEVDAPFSTARLVTNEMYIINETQDRTGPENVNTYRRPDITSKDWETLGKKLSEVDFWSMEQDYTMENYEDATKYTLGVKFEPEGTEPNIKEVTCYGSCPEGLLEIVDLIETMYGSEILNVGV
jgi:hypothetical protein